MLDLRFVCDNIDLVKKKLQLRNSKLDLTELVSLADKRRSLIKDVEALKAQKNKVSAEIAVMKKNKTPCDDLIAEMRAQGEQIKAYETELSATEEKLSVIMYTIPNLVDDSVPYGVDDSDNPELRRFMSPTEFSFTPLSHWEIGEKKGIFNPQQAGYEITGTETGDADKAALLSIRETWGAEAPQKIQDSWTETNAITDFYGVEVNGAGQVVALRLSVMNISSLPDMSTLTQLRELYLDYNHLTQFPTWVCNLTKLVDLNLGSNDLSGEIPAGIGNLTDLEYLYLDNNDLSGEIPAEIGNLTNLWVLYLYNNNLSGTIPEEVLNHPNFNNWNLTPQNDGYGFDNYPVSSEMSKVRSLNDRSAKTEAVRSARKAETEAILSARKAEIRERAVREVR